jgi:hypothetical protein
MVGFVFVNELEARDFWKKVLDKKASNGKRMSHCFILGSIVIIVSIA